MTAAQFRLMALFVFMVGFCAAIPFYRQTSLLREPDTPAIAEAEREPRELTLQVSSSREPPPVDTLSLRVEEEAAESPPWTPPAVRTHPTLEYVPPPDLAPEFEPLLAPLESSPIAREDAGDLAVADGLSAATDCLDSQETPSYAGDWQRLRARHTESIRLADSAAASARTRSPELADLSDAPAESHERHHRIVDGDTLESLAEEYFGDHGLAEALFRANRDVLEAPDILPLGVELKIPADIGQLDVQQPPGPPRASGEPSTDTKQGELVPLRKREVLLLKARSLSSESD